MVDVTFTYTSRGKPITKILPEAEKIPSREALGLWKVDNKAWKVYATTKEYTKLSQDYSRADVMAGLPMGQPSFQQGAVKQGTKAPSEGFILATEWMDGTNFQKTSKSFEIALTRQNISHDKASTDWKRCVRTLYLGNMCDIPYVMWCRTKGGCDAANKVGLNDCQGFVKPGITEPLRFIDVHTSWNDKKKEFGHSGLAAELVEVIEHWGH